MCRVGRIVGELYIDGYAEKQVMFRLTIYGDKNMLSNASALLKKRAAPPLTISAAKPSKLHLFDLNRRQAPMYSKRLYSGESWGWIVSRARNWRNGPSW